MEVSSYTVSGKVYKSAPKQKETKGGLEMASFNLIKRWTYIDHDGNTQEHKKYFYVKAFGSKVKAVMKLSKNDTVLLVGELKIFDYKNKEGEMVEGKGITLNAPPIVLQKGESQGEEDDSGYI